MVHEAFCLDSQGAYLWGVDDFIGDSLDARWTTSVGGTGVAATVVDAQNGGIIRLSSGGTTGGNSLIDWGNYRTLHVDKKITVEWRLKMNQTTQHRCIMYLFYDSNNRINFYNSPAGAASNWRIECRDGGSSTDEDSGILGDTDYHIFKIECFPTGEVRFYIDDVQCANSPITTNIPDDAGDYFSPRIYIDTKENSAKTFDIDYVQWRQDI